MHVYEKIILGLLILMAIINGIFAIAGSYSGPIWGAVFAVFASIHWWKKRNSTFILIIAFVWIVFHIYELIVSGPGPYPVFFYMNLVIPVPLSTIQILDMPQFSI